MEISCSPLVGSRESESLMVQATAHRPLLEPRPPVIDEPVEEMDDFGFQVEDMLRLHLGNVFLNRVVCLAVEQASFDFDAVFTRNR